ncbi:hypothetical protein [Mesorhizobium sp. B2-1-3A]|nr:hypothetical protein [Mesorhizobium sp. B2-1-3A]
MPRATDRSKFAHGKQLAFLGSALAVAGAALCAFLFIRDADHSAG